MDKNDVATGLTNIITEGEVSVKEFLALINRESIEQLYDWLDEYLVETSEETAENEDDEEEDE